MTIHRSLALAIIASTGIVGSFIGRAVPRDAPSTQTVLSESMAPSAAAPVDHDCEAERAELASAKAQLAICTAFITRAPETAPSDVSEVSKPAPPETESPEIRRNREILEGDSEAVIIRRTDGTIGIYKPEEWPIDGDGLIIGRKFSDGKLGWYGRPVAGTPSDPDAPRRNPPMFVGSSIKLQPDGTITMHGKPAPPSVLRMLGGKVDEAAKP
jgi:hypothetical protein